jgi:hypothetical protein
MSDDPQPAVWSDREPRRQMAIQQVVSPQIDLVAGQVERAWRDADSPDESAECLRQAAANLKLLADMIEAID